MLSVVHNGHIDTLSLVMPYDCISMLEAQNPMWIMVKFLSIIIVSVTFTSVYTVCIICISMYNNQRTMQLSDKYRTLWKQELINS